MKDIIYSLPDQMLHTIRLFNGIRGGKKRYDRLLICGMGGSGISGDLLSALYPGIHIIANKDYDIPEHIDRKTLGILISYSGNTEETLTNYAMLAKQRIARIGITSGGMLSRKQLQERILVPPGLPPRGALGYLFTPLPFILYKYGFTNINPRSMIRMLGLYLKKQLKKLDNFSKALLPGFAGRLPVIYADSPAFGVVANRWRCQLNENSKILCHVNIIPEMNHNEIVGVGRPAKLNKDIVYVFLNDPDAHPRNKIRVQIVKEILMENIKVVRILDIKPKGKTRIQQMFWTILIGDLLSYYLAVQEKVDPLPVKRIDYLKRRLAEQK